ncbi:MAG TPA: response regulator transcription factor [Roseiflexaceae bacterium]|nr:response regulator transcription factor [Roseiflexaceae bacterium]
MQITLFLADGHAVLRDGLRMVLDSQPNMRVIGEAANDRETVRQVSALHPDVLLIEIAIAGATWFEMMRQIRLHSPATRIVVLSAYSRREYVARALQAGALSYVLKESPAAEVIEAILAARADRNYFSEKIEPKYIARLASSRSSPLQSLSEREREILPLIVAGKTSVQIGGMLALSPKTVDTYRSRLMHKLGLDNLPNLVKFAIRHGLTTLE